VTIDDKPNELRDPIRFGEDQCMRPTIRKPPHRFWQVLRQADRVFAKFRTGFSANRARCIFFWGSFRPLQ